jgi:hypothetical protein
MSCSAKDDDDDDIKKTVIFSLTLTILHSVTSNTYLCSQLSLEVQQPQST